ncbi:class I SAM-dependent methyltransferase [Demetria terragena]|uniref:class I SAM-dependent methyltransferase n=1 Tax=Demetria terragena TaxID=63959 RepID=UPI000367C74F|nr:methyltransferase [Demetria terragena]
MTEDHYFSAEPASAAERRSLTVELAGAVREVDVASGIFSPGRLDPGTAVLLREVALPDKPGTYLDLGCGWGPIALSLGLAQPTADVWALDVNERALDLMRGNAARLGTDRVRSVRAEEVPVEVRFDEIWSNPPIRVGKQVLHDLLRAWLPRLSPTGVAHLVVQKNLGSDSLQTWIGTELSAEVEGGLRVEREANRKGFRVLRVMRTEA